MTMILNLTQHKATPEQIAAGVVDISDADHKYLANELTFSSIPSADTLLVRATTIATIARMFSRRLADPPRYAMIGGAPYFMRPLEDALWGVGMIPVYAFSVRKIIECKLPNGTVEKTAVFRHA